MIPFKTIFPAATLAAAALLSGCGGTAVPADTDAPTRIALLASSERGMQSIAFNGSHTYVSLSNSASSASQVQRAATPVRADAQWTAVNMGGCALGATVGADAPRAATLKQVAGKTWLFQPWIEGPASAPVERALCVLDSAGTAFTPQDQGLRTCFGEYCYTLWMDDLKAIGNRLYSNAGAGENLLVSDDQAASWRVMLGQFDSMVCTHQSFHIVGSRLLVGSECPLDIAYLRAYQLNADGSQLASRAPLAIQVPELENRNIQFIESVPGTQRVFVGVEGGLLRSDDGGQSFKFVIKHPLEGGKNYPYIGSILFPANQPNTVLVAGFDKANGKPFLAWSADSGDKWTDLSVLLPGYQQSAGHDATVQVTALVQDPQGRLLLTINEELDAKGRLYLLTLGAR
jgi:hypothetical protein